MQFPNTAAWILGAACSMTATIAAAGEFSVTIRGSDAIFLAGRTDLTIPPASEQWPKGLPRHPGPTPEETRETLPPTIPVSGGQVVRVLAPASGGIDFFNGMTRRFGPDGGGASSQIRSFGGISGYSGTQGGLVGVFLGSSVPKSGAPGTLGGSLDFKTLSPKLRQVFFIGDGKNSKGELEEFVVPSGATRLALGVADGWDFMGAPGFYDDNDGAYQIRLSTGPKN
jgi:hypothetical protein